MYDLFNYSIYNNVEENTEEISVNDFEEVINYLNIE